MNALLHKYNHIAAGELRALRLSAKKTPEQIS